MENQKTFNLNDAVLFKLCFDKTECSIAVRRSVRPFIKAINASIQEALPVYEAKALELLEGKKMEDLKEEDQKEFFGKYNKIVFDVNKDIYPNFDLKRNSTYNFFLRFWSPFTWPVETTDPFTRKHADEVDEKVVELFPELDVNVDEPSEESSTQEEITKEPVVENEAEKSDSK